MLPLVKKPLHPHPHVWQHTRHVTAAVVATIQHSTRPTATALSTLSLSLSQLPYHIACSPSTRHLHIRWRLNEPPHSASQHCALHCLPARSLRPTLPPSTAPRLLDYSPRLQKCRLSEQPKYFCGTPLFADPLRPKLLHHHQTPYTKQDHTPPPPTWPRQCTPPTTRPTPSVQRTPT
jgi:hypothetical protein